MFCLRSIHCEELRDSDGRIVARKHLFTQSEEVGREAAELHKEEHCGDSHRVTEVNRSILICLVVCAFVVIYIRTHTLNGVAHVIFKPQQKLSTF